VKFLVAEYCRGPFFMGWHLYLRDSKKFQLNDDGEWGWVRRVFENKPVMKFMASLGFPITGDGTCDDDGIAEFAKRYPENRVVGARQCGYPAVDVDKHGNIEGRIE